MGQLGPRVIAEWAIRTQTECVSVYGLDHVPRRGAVLLVARHVHHLLDGSILVTRLPRPVHIVVGLDWAATPVQRRWIEWACRSAQYPIVLRRPTLERTGVYRRDELIAYTRTAIRETSALLRSGRVVLVFPEGYPNIDPSGNRKTGLDDWLPFAAGFLKMLATAEKRRRYARRHRSGRFSLHARHARRYPAALVDHRAPRHAAYRRRPQRGDGRTRRPKPIGDRNRSHAAPSSCALHLGSGCAGRRARRD